MEKVYAWAPLLSAGEVGRGTSGVAGFFTRSRPGRKVQAHIYERRIPAHHLRVPCAYLQVWGVAPCVYAGEHHNARALHSSRLESLCVASRAYGASALEHALAWLIHQGEERCSRCRCLWRTKDGPKECLVAVLRRPDAK